LDFGQREQIAGLSNGWHPENVPFRVLFPHAGIDPSRAWWSHIVPPGAFDCAMAKPGDPALDPKMVIKPHPTHSGSSPAGVVTVPSCKSK
jgi:hypothetical protein